MLTGLRAAAGLRVLLVGNSHTYLNYMPEMFSALVQSAHQDLTVKVEQSVGDSVGLEWHWGHAPTRERIREGRWDFVVLQERSAGTLQNRPSFMRHARLLDAEIRGTGARTVLYMTWAHRSAPQTQADIADAYAAAAAELGAGLAPAGLAWQRALERHPDLDLHHRDGRHASALGSYLSACVLYAAVTGGSPVGLPPSFPIRGKQRPELTAAAAAGLQAIAWEVVRQLPRPLKTGTVGAAPR